METVVEEKEVQGMETQGDQGVWEMGVVEEKALVRGTEGVEAVEGEVVAVEKAPGVLEKVVVAGEAAKPCSPGIWAPGTGEGKRWVAQKEEGEVEDEEKEEVATEATEAEETAEVAEVAVGVVVA